jgi:NNP family nitrate/nitrite transporter-like MFS transporter
MAKKYGMRGRLWALWIFQTMEGILCIIMGSLTLTYEAPDVLGPKMTGFVKLSSSNPEAPNGGEWVPFNGTCFTKQITHCGHLAVEVTDAMRNCGLSPLITEKKVVLGEPLAPLGAGDDCVANSGMMAVVIFTMFLFSVAVQMAEGLTYGIVPSVSRPALGVVSGMVGAGGNAGSLVTNAAFFLSDSVRSDQGLVDMGWCIVIVTLACFFIYFPESGSMLTGKGSLPYDPQLIKPPADYRGADSMDYTNAASVSSSKVLVAEKPSNTADA